MPFLLDTMVISEIRRKNRSNKVVEWIASVPADGFFLSAVTIGEIENGIIRQRRVNPDFSSELSIWLDSLLQHYGDRVLPFSTNVARRWGRLCGELGRADADMMIAATALEHGLIVSTRNVSHFEPTGVSIINPFE